MGRGLVLPPQALGEGLSPSHPTFHSRTDPLLICPRSVFLPLQDMVTYYLNLTRANLMEEEFPVWEEEYRLTEAFQVPDASAHSMQTVLERISQDPHSLQQYYEFNSVSYDLAVCEESCRVDHVCAIMELDFTRYEECAGTSSSASALVGIWLLFSCLLLGLISAQQALQ